MDFTYSNATPWGLLAYTVADDKSSGGLLDGPVKNELRAMCDACDFARVGVAVQVDFKNTRGAYRAVLTQAPTRASKKAGADDAAIWRELRSRLLKSKLQLSTMSEPNSADGSVLQDFLNFGHDRCPAQRHVVYFYGHSHGPMGLYYDKAAGRRAPKTSLRLNDLATSLETPDCRSALLVFRDCFMSTLEAAYQLRAAAKFMIASQSQVPIAGIWPWQAFIDSLIESASDEDQARVFARILGRFLNTPANRGKFSDVPMTLLNLDAAENVVAPLKALVEALEDARHDRRRRHACAKHFESARIGRNTTADPGDPALVDVETLCRNLQRLKSDDAVVTAAKALADVVHVGNGLVLSHHTQRTPSPHRGVALYYKPVSQQQTGHTSTKRLPRRPESEIYDEGLETEDEENYSKLALIVATGWDRIALNPFSAS